MAHDIGASIAEQRQEETNIAAEGLKQMQSYLEGQQPICKILRDLYDASQRVCGGCCACRQEARRFMSRVELYFEHSPQGSPRCKVVTDCPNPLALKGENPFRLLLRRMAGQKKLRRFACSPTDLESLMKVFGHAFSPTESTLYRLDGLNDDLPFNVQPDETLVFFHLNELNQGALNFDQGVEVVHLIGAGVKYLDSSGRYPNEARGCRIYPSPELWL
jgi:hypothetical protein